jgi:protein required for attachment to host cells
MGRSSEVLVLVADETSATLHANCNGSTRLLHAMDRNSKAQAREDDHARSATQRFADELMRLLNATALRKNCEGVIIFAEGAIMEELRRVQSGLVSRLLIAQIEGRPTQTSLFPGRSAGHAELAYRGALH